DDRYAEMASGGATTEEAERRTRAELRESESVQRELRRVEREVAQEPIVLGTIKRGNMIADFWRDLRYAVRTLRKHPGFTAVIALTMALGIGATRRSFTRFSFPFLPLPAKGLAASVGLRGRVPGKMVGISFLSSSSFPLTTPVFHG